MKKRIGTKLYNTETADCIIPNISLTAQRTIGLYRQHNKQSYFVYDGEDIRAIDNIDAQAILSKYNITDTVSRKPGKNGDTKIGVSTAAADKLAAYCRTHGVTQKKVIEDFINTLVP